MTYAGRHVTSTSASDAILAGGTVATPKFASIGVTTSGTNELVAAVASKKIRVVSMFIVAAGDVDAYFEDSANTALMGDSSEKIDLTANMGFALNYNPVGWTETGAGEAFEINLGGTVAVAGCLTYIEV
jgi:hypothetical protein